MRKQLFLPALDVQGLTRQAMTLMQSNQMLVWKPILGRVPADVQFIRHGLNRPSTTTKHFQRCSLFEAFRIPCIHLAFHPLNFISFEN